MVNVGATPRGFFKHGVSFACAAVAVQEAKLKDPLPVYFLYGRSIELFLKSFLLSQGISIQKLKGNNFGHDLNSLFDEAKKHGILSLIGHNPKLQGIIHLLNQDYSSKRFEYRETGGTYTLPHERCTKIVIDRLKAVIDGHLKKMNL
jgi:HEPN domain-containing protein